MDEPKDESTIRIERHDCLVISGGGNIDVEGRIFVPEGVPAVLKWDEEKGKLAVQPDERIMKEEEGTG